MLEHKKILDIGTASDEGCSSERPRAEQRRYHRLSVNLNVQISWIDSFGFRNEAAAVVKNISAGGFGIQFSHDRPLGSRLKVQSATDSILCSVRHSQPQDEGVYLGLEVLPTLDEVATRQSLDSLGAALSNDSDTN